MSTSLLGLLVVCKLCASLQQRQKDILYKGLELYKTKHPRNLSITFIHGWLVLKDMPCWGGIHDKTMKSIPIMKRKITTMFDVDERKVEIMDVESNLGSTLKQPQIQCMFECTIRVPARAAVDMANARFNKVTIMKDQSMMAFFTMPKASLVSKKA
jgi:hypothetical protein